MLVDAICMSVQSFPYSAMLPASVDFTGRAQWFSVTCSLQVDLISPCNLPWKRSADNRCLVPLGLPVIGTAASLHEPADGPIQRCAEWAAAGA